jgi:hypothetical protein
VIYEWGPYCNSWSVLDLDWMVRTVPRKHWLELVDFAEAENLTVRKAWALYEFE